jgi:hypothetical protein
MDWIRVAREPAKRLPLGQWRYMDMLLPYPDSPSPITKLHAIELVQWDLRGLVLRGLEEIWQRQQRTDYRQAWWVVPLVGSDVAPSRNPIDDAEELEQIEQAMRYCLMERYAHRASLGWVAWH